MSKNEDFKDQLQEIEELPIERGNRSGTHFALENKIGECSRELKYLANAFFTTGNERIANQLFEIGAILAITTKKLRDLHGAETTDMVRDAEQATANMMGGLLAGIQIGSKKEK